MQAKTTSSAASSKAVQLASLLVGAGLATAALSSHAAGTSPFAFKPLDHGYQVAQADTGEAQAKPKARDGKCGEGKCGANKRKAEAKSHDGQCGADKKRADGKCGADKTDKKMAEAKTHDGQCGADKKAADGKCGADKK